MNSPEEKAKQLISKFGGKDAAIICVDEIIDELEDIKGKVSDSSINPINNRIDEYESLKEEIKKLQP